MYVSCVSYVCVEYMCRVYCMCLYVIPFLVTQYLVEDECLTVKTCPQYFSTISEPSDSKFIENLQDMLLLHLYYLASHEQAC